MAEEGITRSVVGGIETLTYTSPSGTVYSMSRELDSEYATAATIDGESVSPDCVFDILNAQLKRLKRRR